MILKWKSIHYRSGKRKIKKMVQLIWSENAINDLNSIGKYIAQDSEYAAQKFIQELIKKASLLVAHPAKGRPIPNPS